MNPSDAIAALRTAGLSEVAIARQVSSTQPTINRIARGVSHPSYALGKALVDLAEQVSRSGDEEHSEARPTAAATGEAAAADGVQVPLKAAA